MIHFHTTFNLRIKRGGYLSNVTPITIINKPIISKIPGFDKRFGALVNRPLPFSISGIVTPTDIPSAGKMAPVSAAPIRKTQIIYNKFATPQAIVKRFEISNGLKPTVLITRIGSGTFIKTMNHGYITMAKSMLKTNIVQSEYL